MYTAGTTTAQAVNRWKQHWGERQPLAFLGSSVESRATLSAAHSPLKASQTREGERTKPMFPSWRHSSVLWSLATGPSYE